MTIERVATNSQTTYMLSQIAKANAKLQQSSDQVASGKVSNDYAGIGDKTAALEAARAAADRAAAYATNTQSAVTQTDLQDTQLTTLSGLASQLKTAIDVRLGKFRRYRPDDDGLEHFRSGFGDPQFHRCQRQLPLRRSNVRHQAVHRDQPVRFGQRHGFDLVRQWYRRRSRSRWETARPRRSACSPPTSDPA
jgi:hypothetical protein